MTSHTPAIAGHTPAMASHTPAMVSNTPAIASHISAMGPNNEILKCFATHKDVSLGSPYPNLARTYIDIYGISWF